MRKRTKAALWVAAGCIFFGGIIMGAGSVAGGYGQLKDVSDNPLGVTFERDAFYISSPNAETKENHLQKTKNFVGEEIVPGQEVLSGDFARSFSVQNLYELEIKTGIHNFTIIESDVDNITVEGVNCDQIQCFVREGELRLLDVGRKNAITGPDDRRIHISIPKDMQWTEVELEVVMAEADVQVLRAQDCELTVDMGAISVKNAVVGNLDVSADMGAVTLEGEIQHNAEADASMGAVIFKLKQKETDFNYQIEASMGSVKLGGKEISGLDKEKMINNQADRTMELEASMGSIEIIFE